MVSIKNGYLSATFSAVGAELKSLSDGKDEYIWIGDEKFWAPSCPVLFPICSGLKGDKYTLSGKEYHLTKHGFAKFETFEVEKLCESSVSFVLRANERTLEKYPYHFIFRITYTLDGKKLEVRYDISNEDGSEMYFSVGAHEGYYCPEGIDKYDILLPEKQSLVSTTLTGPNTLGYETLQVTDNSDVLPLDYKYFAVDALVFLDFHGDNVILKNRQTGRAIKVTFRDFPYLLLWTKPGAPYICIEPWCGLADRDDGDGIFETKQGIQHIDTGKVFTRVHTLEVL